MKLWKSFVVFMMAIAVIMPSAACKNNNSTENIARTPYDKLKVGRGVKSGVIAKNSNYTLYWDEERACVILSDINGNTWSSIPYDYYKTGKTGGRANSMMGAPLMLEYVSKKNKSAIKTMNGYTGIIKNGRMGSKKTADGLIVYYCFDKLEIIVPVEYTLRNNGLCISIEPKKIIEYDNLVYRLSLAPFLCSAQNTSNREEQYIVIPSGSGALMYTDERSDIDLREYKENVYGNDPARYQSQKYENTEIIRIPLFGAKNGNTAICGIIEEGAASASVDAIVGDSKIGWSGVYSTFQLRGSNISAVSYDSGQTTDVENITEEMTGYKKLSIGYYPLTNQKADYSGMACVYRNYLIENYKIGDKKISEKGITLNILGGLRQKSLFFGVPFQKTISVTTFNEALEIIKQVEEVCAIPIDVVLSGFGKSGLDVGEIAGGYKFGTAFGSKKDFNKLKDYCTETGIGCFVDFDIVKFRDSSNGFSKIFNAAKSANSFTAYQYYYSIALRNQESNQSRYVLLNRALLGEASDKLFDFAKGMDIHGISFSTLGNMAYSDYDSKEYFVRGKTESEATSIIENAHKNGFTVMVSEANSYAAAVSDKIINAPLVSSMYDILDADIPLYEIIFKGMVDITSSPVNTAMNQRVKFLNSIESGIGLSFMLTDRYSTESASSKHSALAVSLLADNIQMISELADESKEYYKAINGSKIIKHSLISENIRRTDFDNGISVWVNYGDTPIVLPEGKIEPKSFMFRGENK